MIKTERNGFGLKVIRNRKIINIPYLRRKTDKNKGA
jgi:hypothetical protein